MNYGKRSASKKQKNITSKANMRKKKIGVRLFKGFLLCIAVVCIAGAAGAGLLVKRIIDNAPEITPSSIKPEGYTAGLYDFSDKEFVNLYNTISIRYSTSPMASRLLISNP